MKAGTLLDSVVFQLTPTRTRYDLVIIANGKKEKIASGLLDPFLAHLKAAEDQITKGGYSIRLEPDPKLDATWFTKDTVERFVRYVSSPEVLDRVNTLETEIFQINEAIGKNIYSGNGERVALLSKHGKPRRMSTGSTMSTVHEANSRHQLLRVLESRKNVLQKEQGMALARAVAAGFDIDHMNNLIQFAKSFGASRLLESCSKFTDLWKETHVKGQWLENSCSANITLSKEQYTETWIASNDNLATTIRDNDTQAIATKSISQKSYSGYTQDPQACLAPGSYIPHMQNPMFQQWPTHAPRTSQPYLIQNMSYYHNFSYPSIDNQESTIKNGLKRHSMDPKTSNFEFSAISKAEINKSKKAKSQSTSDVESEKGIHDLPSDNDAENWQTFQKLLLRTNQSDNMSAIECSNEETREMSTQTEEFQKRCFANTKDESYVALCGSSVPEKRVAMTMKSDFDHEIKKKNERCRYEPSDLSMMPDRGMEKITPSFDPAKEFDMQMSLQNSAKKISGKQETVSIRIRGEMKGTKKEIKSKVKDKLSRPNPLADAKARAEKVRAFKADIQKAKKEKEDEERRRLEALKAERQKRISARSNSKNIQSSVNTSQTKTQKLAKSAPLPFNSSKFTDAKPTLLSPLKTANSSPNSYKSSKFTDRQPSPSSPLLKLIRNSKAIGQFAGSPQKNQMQNPKRLFPSSSPVRTSPNNFKSAPLCNTQDTRTQKLINDFFGQSRNTKEMSFASWNVNNGDRLIANTPIVKSSTPQIQNVCVQHRESYESNANSSKIKARKENNTSSRSFEEIPIIEKAVVILENKASVNVEVGSCEDYKSNKESSSFQVVKTSNDVCKRTNPIPTSRSVIQGPLATSNDTACSDARAPNKKGLNLTDRVGETRANSHGIGSPKGFKDLLKFRKKSKSLSTTNLTAANAAPKLKDLLSEESHYAANPSKVSRGSFSSFSPFNSKKKSERRTIT